MGKKKKKKKLSGWMEEREENGLCRLILCDREKGLTREVSQSRVMLDPNPPPPNKGLFDFDVARKGPSF